MRTKELKQEFIDEVDAIGELVARIKLGRYRHYKGKSYELIGIARDSETLDHLAIYRALYKSRKFGNYALWARPVKEFLQKVEVDGKEVPRFKFVGK